MHDPIKSIAAALDERQRLIARIERGGAKHATGSTKATPTDAGARRHAAKKRARKSKKANR